MSFLAPLFLLGALAVGLPVVFHLIRRSSREKVPFSSLMFLLPTPPRLTRRSRLEHIILLLLRCVVLCLLAAGFARPFIQRPVDDPRPTGPGKKIAVLIDTSASMRRTNLWNDALAKAREVFENTTPLDSVAVYVFDRTVTRVVSFEDWTAMNAGQRTTLTLQRLGQISPGWHGTHLGNALVTVAEALDDSSTADKQPVAVKRQIFLISDMQEGSRLDRLQAYEWPKGTELIVEPVKARHTGNAGVQLVGDSDESDRKANDAGQRVRVSNTSDAKKEQFQVGWARPGEKTFAGLAMDVYVPPGQSRVVSLPAMPPGADRVILHGDDEDFDNAAYIVPLEAVRANVLFLGNDSEKDSTQPLYYLKRAFQQTRRQIAQVVARPMSAPLLAAEAVSPLIIVDDSLPEEHVSGLRQLLNGGQTILFVMKDVAAAASIARLLQLDQLPAEEVVEGGNRYAMLSEINFQHPVFAPFADPRYSDFTKIHFWKHRRVDSGKIPGARTLAKFDNGDPALLQIPVGKGSLLVLTSSWHPADSQLALSTKFVPLLYSLLELGGSAPARSAQYFVDDSIPLSLTNAAAPISVLLPDGKSLALTNGAVFSQTDTPGIYTISAAQLTQRFAVNLDVAESKSNPIGIDEFERLGAPVKPTPMDLAHQTTARRQLQNAELENQQKLWRWILVAALAVLLVETCLAGWMTRHPTVSPES